MFSFPLIKILFAFFILIAFSLHSAPIPAPVGAVVERHSKRRKSGPGAPRQAVHRRRLRPNRPHARGPAQLASSHLCLQGSRPDLWECVCGGGGTFDWCTLLGYVCVRLLIVYLFCLLEPCSRILSFVVLTPFTLSLFISKLSCLVLFSLCLLYCARIALYCGAISACFLPMRVNLPTFARHLCAHTGGHCRREGHGGAGDRQRHPSDRDEPPLCDHRRLAPQRATVSAYGIEVDR